MTAHKFKVGQVLEFSPGRMGFPASTRACKILRLLPPQDGELQYRIKCTAENFERVAKESTLSRRS
jgi:hypothetical protein